MMPSCLSVCLCWVACYEIIVWICVQFVAFVPTLSEVRKP